MALVDEMGRRVVAVASCVVLRGEDMFAAAFLVTEAAEEGVTVEEAVIGTSVVMASILVAAEVILVDATALSELDAAD